MNAVERMLAHAEQLIPLFDEMYREVDEKEYPEWLVGKIPPVFLETPLVHHFYRLHWWKVASTTAGCSDNHASEILRERLARRESLLDEGTWQRLFADVVRDCREWDFLKKKVVRLAQTVADRVLFIEDSESRWLACPASEWREHRQYLLRDLGFLRRYAQPPAAGSTSEKQASSAKRKKRRDRKGVGGRPEKFTMKFIREVVDAREHAEKHAAKVSKPLPSFPRWLSDYCSGKEIDIGKMFPPKTPGETWSIRANRFWKAAKKRLREAETNRH